MHRRSLAWKVALAVAVPCGLAGLGLAFAAFAFLAGEGSRLRAFAAAAAVLLALVLAGAILLALRRTIGRPLAALLRLKSEVEAGSRRLAEANGRLEARVAELTLLHDVARDLTSTLALSDLLRRVVERVGAVLGPETELAVLLVDPDGGDLEVAAAVGFAPGVCLEGTRFRRGEGASGAAVLAGRPLVVPDVARDPRCLHYHGKGRGTGSFLAAPLVHQGRTVGLLNLSRPATDAFPPEELRLVESIADQAALAIANARLHEETVALSLTDPLTGLANRRSLFARLELEVARVQRFGGELTLAMIDVDHFKRYNDANGHLAGDEALREVARLLRGAVRRLDLVARFGGEEFAVILPGVRQSEAAEVAEKLRRTVGRASFPWAERQPGGRITISVGHASCPADARDSVDLVDLADAALFASKRAGRDRATAFEPGMELHPARERDRTELEGRLGVAPAPPRRRPASG